jgi:hypothetical protein
MSKKIEKVEFAPGCFDDFDGTQEELDALVKEIENKFIGIDDSDLEVESVPIEDVWDDLDEDTQDKLIEQLKQIVLEKSGEQKKLN